MPSWIPGLPPKWNLADLTTENPEHILFDSVICEFTDIAGFPVDFYFYNPANEDRLYGEATLGNFDGPYRTKLVYEPVIEENLLSPFGIIDNYNIVPAMIPRTNFARDVSKDRIPGAGDLVRLLWNDKLMEIVDINMETKIFQGKKLIWEFNFKSYRHSEQTDDNLAKDTQSEFVSPDINHEDDIADEMMRFGENDFIKEESSKVDKMSDINTKIYGFGGLDD